MPTSVMHRDFYHSHKGLILNAVSIGVFFWLDWVLQGDLDKGLQGHPLLIALFVGTLLTEPWATYYNMGAFNLRREQAGHPPIFLQRMVYHLFWACLFWGGRLALFGALLLSSLDAGAFLAQYKWMGFTLIGLLMLREGLNVYFWGSEKPLPKYNGNVELMADIALVVFLAFGELFVAEVFKEFSPMKAGNFKDFLLLLFPTILFFVMLYIPIRFVYTLEEATFARTWRERLEFAASFLLVFVAMLAKT